MNREIDAQLATNALRRTNSKPSSATSICTSPTNTTGSTGQPRYWPTTAESWSANARIATVGRVATSLLRARGFKTAHIVANLNHVWVAVDKTELMGPEKEKNLRRVGGEPW